MEVLALSLIFAFLCLVALYESWKILFAVMLSVPTEIFGALLAEVVTRNLASVYMHIGIVTIGFDGGKYSEPLIESFAAAYKHVIAQFLSKEKISDIDWLSADELAKIKNIHNTAWKVVERPAYRLLQDSAEKFR